MLASIALQPGSAPSAVVAAYGSIWVESHRGTLLYRIDPAIDTVVAEIDVGQESCGIPGVGFGRMWVMPCDTGTKTMVVDPDTNEVVDSFAGAGSIAFANGSAWTLPALTTADGTFERIDPSSFKVISTTVVGQNPIEAVVGAGFIWVSDDSPSTGTPGGVIAKVDPKNGRVIATLSTPAVGTYSEMTYAFGSLWLKGSDNNRLMKVDPRSGHVTTHTISGWAGGLIQLWDIPPAAGLGSLWMRIANGSVVRVNPADGTVLATYPADPQAGGGYVTVAFGSLWVANFGTDTVWRVRIQG